MPSVVNKVRNGQGRDGCPRIIGSEEPDPQIANLERDPGDIEEGMSVENTLRTLDELSQQIEQRKDEAMAAVTEAMDALEQGDTEELSKSIESLRKQNMLPI